MYNIIGKKKIWFTFSGILLAISITALLVWGLRLGIDFTGGSLLEISYNSDRPSITEIEENLSELNLNSLKIQPSNDLEYILRFEEVNEDIHQEILNKLGQDVTQNRFETIGPVIGNELKSKSIKAIILVLLFIVFYIAWAFRKVSKPVSSWKYGLSAIIALAHDILIITGIFSIFGYFFKMEVDSLFVTALLTILGFSVHDTIVTFDRTRENLFREHDKPFDEIVNISVNQTIIRSLNTSITTLFVLVAIYIFGGESIKNFVLALILGIIIGTYSSIFIASPLLSLWRKKS